MENIRAIVAEEEGRNTNGTISGAGAAFHQLNETQYCRT
jgi:hypothetical protein